MKDLLEGYKRVIEFDNGYGLSIVSHGFSYGGKHGLFEIALLKNGDMIYDSDLGFSDVIGNLDFAQVAEIIDRISKVVK